MTTNVPFDPPYKAKRTSDEGERWVEVLADGTEIDTVAPAPMTHFVETTKKPAAPSSSSKPAAAILKVPFAEKDEAKQLGARWDAAKKKWYVPLGTDLAPFSRWLSS